MITVSEILPAGSWDAGLETDQVLIDYDERFRRRIVFSTSKGAEVLIDLPRAVRLRDGDGLRIDGGVVRIVARSEPLMEVEAQDTHALIRITWHLGNRHLPVQLLEDRIRIRRDHVIVKMIQLLGGHVTHVDASFDPEPGAYSGGHNHHHHDDDQDG